MRILTTRVCVTLAFVALLASCTSAPVSESLLWEFDGKLSVRAQGQTDIVSVSWQEFEGASQIQLSGPVGLGAVDIEIDAERMTLSSANGREVLPRGSPITWEDRRIELPWQSMTHWVRGKGIAGQVIPAEGLKDGLWEVRILREDAQGPRLMTFEHPEVSLRLSVNKWGFGAVSLASDPI